MKKTFCVDFRFPGRLLKSVGDDKFLAAMGIGIETLPRFYSKFAGSYHIHQQGARRVFGIAEPIVKHMKNREANIQSDEVCQLQRPHGVRHAQFHNGIDLFYTCDAFK